ncbi:histidine phosphatase family protein [Marinobacter fonticola]|uniref:histidine phosphatase family protein n=1 Tax=Marinobacter fonticola TaxID=2603215 RepID=UPI0011E75442|nr:histidine phosphatase family protein [Marinobacter fonticola]
MNQQHTLIDLIRHGEPEGGPKFRGTLDDPLSDLGWHHMAQATRGENQWDAVIASPLRRCREFAEKLAAERNLPLTIEEGIREVSFGEWEGKTSAAVAEAYGDHLKNFWANPVDHTPPGGEALGIFHKRVIESWSEILQKHDGQKILLVCHGGIIRMILAEVLGIPLERSFAGFAVPFACRSRIRVDRTPHGTFYALLSHTPLPAGE